MTSIQIRDVPDSIHKTLKQRAIGAGLSLSEYLLSEITRVAERPEISDVLRMSESRQGGADIDEIVAAVRLGRDRS